jgi:hypothetical protein
MVAELDRISLAVQPILDILAAVDMLEDDREPAIFAWYHRQAAGLPEPMAEEMGVWFDVLHNGSTTPPRSHPMPPATVRLRISYVMPALKAWAGAGHESLREITRDDVQGLAPARGKPSRTGGTGLALAVSIAQSPQGHLQ